VSVFFPETGEDPIRNPRLAVYRGGTWLPPFHRMVPPPRSFAADAHGCIMVAGSNNGPTEYKVAGAILPRPWQAPLGYLSRGHLALTSGLGMLRVKARAGARPLRG
jgi:hypothetical protein